MDFDLENECKCNEMQSYGESTMVISLRHLQLYAIKWYQKLANRLSQLLEIYYKVTNTNIYISILWLNKKKQKLTHFSAIWWLY